MVYLVHIKVVVTLNHGFTDRVGRAEPNEQDDVHGCVDEQQQHENDAVNMDERWNHAVKEDGTAVPD